MLERLKKRKPDVGGRQTSADIYLRIGRKIVNVKATLENAAQNNEDLNKDIHRSYETLRKASESVEGLSRLQNNTQIDVGNVRNISYALEDLGKGPRKGQDTA